MKTIGVTGSQTTWKEVQVFLNTNTGADSTANLFTITVDGNSALGESIHFSMLSLFPPTFKNRENGMRVDIAEVRRTGSLIGFDILIVDGSKSKVLSEMKPSFFRLPGGNNLEGQTFATRWQWNNTVLLFYTNSIGV